MFLKYQDVEGEDYLLDSIDYLSKGLPPRKTEADACLRAFAQELVDRQYEDEDGTVDDTVSVDADLLDEAMHRVYLNNVANTKRWIAISVGAGVAGLLVGALFINTGK